MLVGILGRFQKCGKTLSCGSPMSSGLVEARDPFVHSKKIYLEILQGWTAGSDTLRGLKIAQYSLALDLQDSSPLQLQEFF